MKFGITGGAGYLGSTLVKELAGTEHNLISIDNESTGDYTYLKNNQITSNVKLVNGDIRDQELLVNNWIDCDAIAHLAALPGLDRCNENPEEAISVNVYGTHK